MYKPKAVITRGNPINEIDRVATQMHPSLNKVSGNPPFWLMVPITEEEAKKVGVVILVFPRDKKDIEVDEISQSYVL